MVLLTVVVKRPELTIAIFPAEVAFPANVTAVPVRLIPPLPVAFTLPLKVVETEPAA